MSNQRLDLAILAALLKQGRWLMATSIAVSAIGWWAWLNPLLPMPYARVALAISLLAGLLQLYCGIRVSFDAELFKLMADPANDWQQHDDALRQLTGKALPQSAEQQRRQGALRWFRWQQLCLALQLLALLPATVG